MMDWNLRYSTENSSCLFCGGPNHLMHTAIKWTPETGKVTGLPRPSVPVDPVYQEEFGIKRTIPIPWNTDPADTIPRGRSVPTTTPTPDSERSHLCVKFGLCPMCGKGFEPGEITKRWLRKDYGTSGAESDNYPLHAKCMQVALIHCPHFRDQTPDNFETGPYEKLRANAEVEGKGEFMRDIE